MMLWDRETLEMNMVAAKPEVIIIMLHDVIAGDESPTTYKHFQGFQHSWTGYQNLPMFAASACSLTMWLIMVILLCPKAEEKKINKRTYTGPTYTNVYKHNTGKYLTKKRGLVRHDVGILSIDSSYPETKTYIEPLESCLCLLMNHI